MREENENGEDVDGNENAEDVEEEQHVENELEWQEGDQTTGLAGRGTPMEIQQGYFERTDTASLGSGWSNSDWREWSDGYWGPDGCWIPYLKEESREDLWDEGKENDEKEEGKENEMDETEEGKENEKDETEEGKENDEKEEDAGKENEKDETEEGKENENDEPKEEEKDPIPTTKRRHSRKSPPSEDGSGLIASPAEKKNCQ